LADRIDRRGCSREHADPVGHLWLVGIGGARRGFEYRPEETVSVHKEPPLNRPFVRDREPDG